MWRFDSIVLLIVVVLSFAASGTCANVHHNPPTKMWVGRKTLTWLDANNEVRYVEVYAPKSAAKKSGTPIVMWFMGSRRNIRPDYHYLGISYEDCEIPAYAEKNKFMFVAVDQMHVKDKGWSIADSDPLDESLVMDVLGFLKRTFRVDDTRIYLWGISAGGKFAQYVGLKHPEVFTAIVSFSGVVDDFEGPVFADTIRYAKSASRKLPMAHWQTEGDYESLIRDMPRMLDFYRELGYPVEFVWLKNTPGRELKHAWYADLYNQRMWDWCKKYRLIDGKTVVR